MSESGESAGPHRRRPRVLNIPPSVPFLPVLIDGILSGEVVPSFRYDAADPLALAELTLLVPTRRAVRSAAEAFLERLGGEAAILPKIRPLGDIDEDEPPFAPPPDPEAEEDGETAGPLAGSLLETIPPAIDPLARRLALAPLVAAWTSRLPREALRGQVRAGATPGDALRLAGDLGALIDAVATEEAEFSRLASLVPEDFAEFWQLSLAFLSIATEAWPQHLAEIGRLDPAERRRRVLDAAARRLAANPPAGPVIAAGSTGSIPATARLLAAIARLPNGAVVLPGLDTDLDEESWRAILPADGPPLVAHPQYGLARLIAEIGISRADVVPLAAPAPAAAARARLVSEALRPAETTDAWARSALPPEERALASEGIALIEARQERELSAAIALALREGLERGDAILVTPERELARRVAAELGRFGITVDDSAGIPLADTPPAMLARLAAALAADEEDPAALASLLAHPLLRLGRQREVVREAGEALEILMLRGPRRRLKLAELADAVERETEDVRHPVRKRLAGEARPAACLARDLAVAFAPLLALETASLAEHAAALTAVLAAISRTVEGEALAFAGEAGEGVARALAITAEAGRLKISRADLADALIPLFEGAVVRPPAGEARVRILGQLEARMQSAGRVVLAPLEEGVWPGETRTDAFLSRPMRAGLGLEAPERRIGLAAHDFAQALGATDVVLARAERAGNAPTVPSRFLQRLLAVAGEDAAGVMRQRGARFLDWARALDAAEGEPLPAPQPRPPLARRPASLPVTRIETLIRDPYAIFAEYVLGLAPLDPLDADADAAVRGILVHEVAASFSEDWDGPFDASARAAFLMKAAEAFEKARVPPARRATWWPRLERIADWFLAWEAQRAPAVAARHVERKGRMEIPVAGSPFTLTGRADRIDVLRDGRLAILDFKTGAPPTGRQVGAGFAPQLPLEAAMARVSAFEGVPAAPVASLEWVRLSGVREDGSVTSAVPAGATAEAVADQFLDRLKALIAAYRDESKPYVSRARVFRQNETGRYDHLARVKEWARAGEEDEA